MANDSAAILLPIDQIITKESKELNTGSFFYINDKTNNKTGFDGLYIACLNNGQKQAYNLNTSFIYSINVLYNNIDYIDIFEILGVNLIIDIKSSTITKKNNSLLVEDGKLYLFGENKDMGPSYIHPLNKYFLRDLNGDEKGNFLQKEYLFTKWKLLLDNNVRFSQSGTVIFET